MTISGHTQPHTESRPANCQNQPGQTHGLGSGRSMVAVISLSVLTALALSLSLSSACLATKLNATPLPHAGATTGATATDPDVNEYGRPVKDFANGKEDTLPPSQWRTRKLDYRDAEKQQKEEAAAKQKAQADAVKKAQDDRVNAIKQYQQISIDANNKGILLGKQGKFSEAIAQHELACKYDPSNKQFRINLSAAETLYGEKLLTLKDSAGAANMLRKALGAAPDNGQAGKYLSQAIQKMGLDPNLADNRLGIGDQLAAAGDISGANIEYQQAMLLDPSARTYTKMGEMAMRYGPSQATNAVSWLRQAIVKNPDYGPAHRGLGNLMLLMKDNTGAASELRKAVILDPKDTAAGQSLIDIWRRQVSLNPSLAENHLGLATAMQLTGDLGTAESEYNQVERLDPRNASLTAGRASLQRAKKHLDAEQHRAAAETFLNQGLGRDALAEIGQAVMTEPRNDQYQFLLGQALESSNDLENAKQAFHTCVLINPKNEEAAKHLRDIENSLSQGGQGGRRSQPPQYQSLSRGDPGGSQAGPQSGQVGIGSTQGYGQAGAQGSGQNGGASGRDKNMFEGNPQTAGNGSINQGNSAATGQNGAPQYRNQNQNPYQQRQFASNPAAQPANPGGNASQRPPQQAAPAAIDPQTQATLTAADNFERQRDFQGAANLLKQSLDTNLQNPDIHHRLAVNLLNLGQLEEAVSEFRIASALNPTSKMFMDDYARALKIHKKALMSDSGGQGGANGQATGAVGDLK